MNLILYADESGTNHPTGARPTSEVPVIAGYIGWRDEWKRFCPTWKAVLKRYDVENFHAVEFNRRKYPDSPYYSWGEEKAECFIYALAEIAGKYIPVGGGYHIKEHHRENPNEGAYIYKYPMAYFFSDLATALEEFGFLNEKISIVFDSTTNKKWMAAIAEQIELLKKVGIKICGHAYGDDEDYLPLQAADLVSNRTRQRHFEKLERQIEIKKQTGKDEHVYLRPTVFDIMLSRNLHPIIGFHPKLNAEILKEVTELSQKHKSVKRALMEIPDNYFKLHGKRAK